MGGLSFGAGMFGQYTMGGAHVEAPTNPVTADCVVVASDDVATIEAVADAEVDAQ